MRRILGAFLISFCTLTQAETFIGPTSATNRFLVASNELVLVKRQFNLGNIQVIANGQAHTVNTGELNNFKAIAGSAELIIASETVLWIERITNHNVTTVFLSAGETNSIPIPNSRRLQVFPTSGVVFVDYPNGVSILASSAAFSEPIEIEGPATVRTGRHPNATGAGIVSYRFVDDVQVLQRLSEK